MTKISKMTDRELLELILTNQIVLAQEITKIKAVAHNQAPKIYSEAYKSKLDIFKGLLDNSDEFLSEFASEEAN